MSNSKFLADYAYLAEASYANFIDGYDDDSVTETLMKSDDDDGIEAPESFATLVTNNYEVMAHYKDRNDGKESSFSGTLFKGREGTENAGNYVIS